MHTSRDDTSSRSKVFSYPKAAVGGALYMILRNLLVFWIPILGHLIPADVFLIPQLILVLSRSEVLGTDGCSDSADNTLEHDRLDVLARGRVSGRSVGGLEAE